MTHHVRVLSFGVSMILLTMLVLSWTTAQARTSSDTRAEASTNLSADKRAKFVKGAKDVAGLDEDQVARVLEQDPELIDEIPVERRVTTETINLPSRNLTPSVTRSSTLAANSTCGSKLATIEYLDANNQPLFKFQALKKWCLDGQQVLSGSMDAGSWIREDARYTPEKGGWRYADWAESGTEQFRDIDGRYHASHRSSRAGKHEFLFPGDEQVATSTRSGIIQTGYYNGWCDSKEYDPLPAPKISTGPDGPAASTTAEFVFSNIEPETTFSCNRDGGGFKVCTSPKVYTSLTEGLHTLQIDAVDARGNAVIKSTVRKWKVDLTGPSVANATPPVGASGVVVTTNVAAVFSEDVEAASLIGNFALVQSDDTETAISAALSYDPATKKAILNPSADLLPGKKYTATVKGGENGVTDRAGNPLATNKTWSFTVAP